MASDYLLEASAASGTVESRRTARIARGECLVRWQDLGAAPGDRVGLRLVVRDGAGQIVQTVPADGLDRRVVIPEVGAETLHWNA